MILDNPVLKKELLCGLRSPKSFVVLLAYVSLICMVILPIWPAEETMTTNFRQRGRDLFNFFTIGQFVVIAMMAPAVAASAFSGEKERRVYDLIYTSPLHLPTVIVGKLLAAILFLLLLISSSLPAMSVCFQLGGVSGQEVVWAYVFLGVAAVAFGMIALFVSAHADRSATALMVSYLIIAPIVVVIAAVARTSEFFFESTYVLVMLFLLGWLAAICFGGILSSLKKPFNPVAASLEQELVEEQEFLQFNRNDFPEKLLAPPKKDDLIADGANIIYEKELRSEIFGRGTLFIRIIIMLGLLASLGFIFWIFEGEPHLFVYYVIAFGILVAPAFSCGVFSLERERRTMDMLLASLITPSRFVLGKFAAVFRFTSILTMLLTLPLLEWVFLGERGISRGVVLIAILGYFAIILATVALSCAVSMFISMTAHSTVEAMLKSYVVLAGLFVGTFVVHAVLERYSTASSATAPPQAGFLWMYLFAVTAVVAHALWDAAQRRLLWSLPRRLFAFVPLFVAGLGLVAMLVAVNENPRVSAQWENSLGVFSPFLAAMQVTSGIAGRQQLGSLGELPSAYGFVAFAVVFAAATLCTIIGRWNQVMYVEGK